MSNIITIGYTTEGTTDKRFLDSIIKKTFDQIAFECETMIEVYDPVYIPLKKSDNFVDDVCELAVYAFSIGISVLCIHVDADAVDDSDVFARKINPAFFKIETCQINVCKNTIAIVPVRMSEAWMLADKEVFKSELQTNLTDETLGINKFPESFADPKAVIREALRIAQENLPQRRPKVTISEIYQPIGQKASILELEKLNSFRKFKEAIRNSFIKLNYLH